MGDIGDAALHPWLSQLLAAPETAVDALVAGHADIYPYSRAEPVDAAASLLFGIDRPDVLEAFDEGCLGVLQALGAELAEESPKRVQRAMQRIARLLPVIARLAPLRTVADLHARFAEWFDLLGACVGDAWLDLRREFLRTVATQPSAGTVTTSRRTAMSFWQDVAVEAGPGGRYDETYLDVALLGLRKLPLDADHDSNEALVVRALVRWADAQQPTTEAFEARWTELEAAYPRTSLYWAGLTDEALSAMQQQGQEAAGPAVSWLSARFAAERLRSHFDGSGGGRPGRVRLPPEQQWRAVVASTHQPLQTIQKSISQLMLEERRYADATGDTYYLARTACNVAMRLLEHQPRELDIRGKLAEELALEVIEYAPQHSAAWTVLRNGLAAQRYLEDAELVGWEAIRRFPEEFEKRSQLAGLLSDVVGRPLDAERLLRDTVTMFPAEVSVRVHLAGILMDNLYRSDEAEKILRDCVDLFENNEFVHAELAIALADKLNRRAESLEVIKSYLAKYPPQSGVRSAMSELLYKADSNGNGLLGRTKQKPRPSKGRVNRLGLTMDFAPAEARRALLMFEAGTEDIRRAAQAEILRLSRENPRTSYVSYAAERGQVASEGLPTVTDFAIAFERASREASLGTLERLVQLRTGGLEGHIARTALAIMRGDQLTDGLPASGRGAVLSRFATLTAGIVRSIELKAANWNGARRLLSDFVACELSIPLAA